MAVPPRRIRQLPPAHAAKDTDVFPISQIGDDGVPTTRAMTRAQNNAEMIAVINAARQEFVDSASAEHNALHLRDDELQALIDANAADDEDMQSIIAMLQEQVANGSGGKNAFQLWQELPGNSGKTLEQFLEAMKGATGAMGPSGAQGAQGIKGDRGDIGPVGADGTQGPTGATGEAGTKGEKGETGATGAQGVAGAKGDTGQSGPVGANGPKGDTGATGPAGSTGPTGPKGDTGSQGDVGPQGAQGIQGAIGPAGLGTVTPSTPTRALNAAFRPSTTKATLVSYTVTLTAVTPALIGSSTALVQLLSDANATPTTERTRAAIGQQVGLSVSIAITDTNSIPLTYIVPAGHYVLLKSTVTGGGTAAITSQAEEALG